MSYNVRDDNGLVGPAAGVEILNGAGAPTIVNHQLVEVVGLFGLTASTAVNGKYCVFIAPPNPSAATGIAPLGSKYQVLGIQYSYNTASASGTLAFEICAPGTADGSGVNVGSSATFSTSAASTNTPLQAGLNSNIDNLQLSPNSRLNVILAGTWTGLVNLAVCVYVARIA